jgi:uncharacterized membrane protein
MPQLPPGNIALTMATPTPDSQFIDELVADTEAYLQRCSVLTEFAESQVQERVRLTRVIDQLRADREAHLQTIDTLHERLRSLEQSRMVRLALVPRRVWYKVRRRSS